MLLESLRFTSKTVYIFINNFEILVDGTFIESELKSLNGEKAKGTLTITKYSNQSNDSYQNESNIHFTTSEGKGFFSDNNSEVESRMFLEHSASKNQKLP